MSGLVNFLDFRIRSHIHHGLEYMVLDGFFRYLDFGSFHSDFDYNCSSFDYLYCCRTLVAVQAVLAYLPSLLTYFCSL